MYSLKSGELGDVACDENKLFIMIKLVVAF